MPYQSMIPQATDQISDSQQDLLENFESIQPAFDQNHMDFNAGADIAGQHTFVQLNGQTAWPAIGSFPGSVGFWANAAHAVFLHNAAGADINLSAVTTSGGINYTYLPSGLLIKYGTASTPVGSHNLYIDLNLGGVPAYTTARFAFLTGKHVPHFVVVAEDSNDLAHPVLRYLYVSTHDAAGAPQNGSQFNWLTIGS